ncbi:hypothetical protein J6590_055864 [Homalodisca vitripennis]|nr:hypothetical protein J6590_055864 [Homalodisca vitripennis]
MITPKIKVYVTKLAELQPTIDLRVRVNEKVTWSEHMIVSQMRPGGNNDNTKDQSLCYKISGVATDNLEPQSTQQDVVNEKVTWSEHMIVSQMRPGGNNDNTKDQSLCYKISGVATDNLEPQSTQQDVVNEKVTWSEHMIVSQMRPGGNNDHASADCPTRLSPISLWVTYPYLPHRRPCRPDRRVWAALDCGTAAPAVQRMHSLRKVRFLPRPRCPTRVRYGEWPRANWFLM